MSSPIESEKKYLLNELGPVRIRFLGKDRITTLLNRCVSSTLVNPPKTAEDPY